MHKEKMNTVYIFVIPTEFCLLFFQENWPSPSEEFSLYQTYIKNTKYAEAFDFYSQIEKLMDKNMSAAVDMVASSTLIKKNFVKLSVVARNKNGVTEYRDIPAITFESFIGSLGGILNLWVGLSFITIIEIIDLIINLLLTYSKNKHLRVNFENAQMK